jgi:prepilin-type N-terminal cleavage/methylation domain-containing protein
MQTRRGFSLIELLIVISIIMVILAIGIPRFRAANIRSREMAAQATIRSLQTAESQYYSDYGRFAASLQELGKPTSGAENASAAGLIGADLAKGEKQGYRYKLEATARCYQIHAEPAAFGISGNRTFHSDDSQEIHFHEGQDPATAADPEIK